MHSTAGDITQTPGTRYLTSSEAGLSLIEVMVTLSLIAVATSMIVLTSIPNDRTDQEAQRLRLLLEGSAERALVTGQAVGFIIDGNTYSSATWIEGEWKSASRTQHQLPSGFALEISPRPQHTLSDEEIKPALVFDPLGHSTPVTLTLSDKSASTQFTVHADGRIELDVSR